MKYLLNEKYTLNEARFILNEDAAADAIILGELKKVTDKITGIIDLINKNKTDFTANKELVKKLNDQLKLIELYDSVDYVRAYINTFNTAVNKNTLNLPQYAEIKHLLDGINAELLKAKPNINLIKVEIKKFNNMVSQVFKTDDSLKVTALSSLNTANELVNKIKDNVALITTSTDDALAAKNAIQDLYKNIPNKSLIVKNNTLVADEVEKAKTACDTFAESEAVKTITTEESKAAAEKAAEDAKAKAEADVAASEKKDWAALYSECKTTEEFKAFWADYYNTEWGAEANRVKSFGKAFENELKVLGFDSITNPFLNFLKTDAHIIKFNITSALYPEFHNAVVNHLLDKNDLLGMGKFGKANIIFNKSLWELNNTDFNSYLELQARLDNELGKLEAPLDDLVKDLDGREIFLKNIMLANGDINDPANTKVKEITSGDLRPLTAARQKVEQLLGRQSDKQVVADDEIVRKANDIIKTNTEAKKVLKFLVDYFSALAPATVNNFLATNKNIEQVIDDININPTRAEKIKYIRDLNLATWKFSDRQVGKLLHAVAVKANLIKGTAAKA